MEQLVKEVNKKLVKLVKTCSISEFDSIFRTTIITCHNRSLGV